MRRRLLRILLNAATVLSLCAGVALLVWTLRSPHESLAFRLRSGVYVLAFERAAISLGFLDGLPIPDSYVRDGAPQVRPVESTLSIRDLGLVAFASGRAVVAPGGILIREDIWRNLKDFPYHRVTVPNLSAILLLLSLAIARAVWGTVRQRRSRSRRIAGHCPI